MVEAIVKDKKRLIPCAAYCDKEYGVGGYYVGVPVVIGAKGVERVVEIDLTSSEREMFDNGIGRATAGLPPKLPDSLRDVPLSVMKITSVFSAMPHSSSFASRGLISSFSADCSADCTWSDAF